MLPQLLSPRLAAVLALTSLFPTGQSGVAQNRIRPFQQRTITADVLTYHNDNAHTGQYLNEHTLTPQNVNVNGFGKLFSMPLDGKMDAQPLFVSDVMILHPGSEPHFVNVVFAATEHDSVYAFDADTGAVYWKTSLLGQGETTSDILGCSQVIPEIGITATPVIDRTVGPAGILYLVAMTKDGGGSYHQRIHALDLSTGAEQLGGPVEIQASYPGTGKEINTAGEVIFNPQAHEDRSPLLLVNNTIYTSWTSHCDKGAYTGWVIGYDKYSLRQTAVFNFAPNGSEASIWNGGSGPAADAAGNLFFSVANGTFDTTLDAQGFPNQSDYGNSFLKLVSTGSPTPTLALRAADYWTMSNTVAESNQDLDLGSGGLVLLPDLNAGSGTRQLAVGAGKDANIYIFDRNNMGKFNPASNSGIYQEVPSGLGGKLYSQPAWFGNTVYLGAVTDNLRAYRVSNAILPSQPSSMTALKFPYPGTNPVISANGDSNAIVWAFENDPSQAVLHAYDANNLATELYNSNQAASGRDQFGPGNKFISPTVANGHVYVGTTNSVAVFGLLPRNR